MQQTTSIVNRISAGCAGNLVGGGILATHVFNPSKQHAEFRQ
jgi:hypothetical protein